VSMPAQKAEAVSLGRRAYAAIRAMILERRLMGGDVVSEDRLAAELSISRTPVREALLSLKSEGLLEKEMNRPFRVRVVSNREYFQSMRLRELLEGEAIVAAIGRIEPAALADVERAMLGLHADPSAAPAEVHWAADEKLHDAIADAAGNDVMAQMIRDLRVTTRLYELSGLPSRFRPDTVEHLTIIERLKDNEPDAAREAMKAHIRSLTDHVLSVMASL